VTAKEWHGRWEEGRIGFHRDEVHDRLHTLWPTIGAHSGAVFVPLCGKSLDMRWLVSAGHDVVGVELSERAARDFFSEWGVAVVRRVRGSFVEFSGGGVRILVGDFFDLDASLVGPVVAVYDRAALVALDLPTRARYVERLFSLLPPGCRGLLITLEFPAGQMAGPPFSVDETEVRELFGEFAELRLLADTDIHADEPRLAAQLSRLVEQAFVWSRS
jgi:thiopurine S-methyltransferase